MSDFDDLPKAEMAATLSLRNMDRGRDRRDQNERAASTEADEEARMRQALGLFGQRAGASQNEHHPTERRSHGTGGSHMQIGARRHRFVQDGEVPVSVVRGRRDQQSSDLAPALPRADRQDDPAADRQRADYAERRFADSQATIRSLQTRLGDAEMAREQAVAALQALQKRIDQGEFSAPPQNGSAAAPPPAEADRQPAPDRQDEMEFDGPLASRRLRAAPPRKRREDAAPDAPAPDGSEPEPIKWWL